VAVHKNHGKDRQAEHSAVEQVPLSSFKRRRRGKHFQLMEEVLKELAKLASESAVKIPLGNYSAKDLRSAVARAAAGQSIAIASASDQNNLYVWKKNQRPKSRE
jgi:hypothetical protein